jgi:ABC-type nitrate/sulfonate/bicarbonate transport system substrate-binding protein
LAWAINSKNRKVRKPALLGTCLCYWLAGCGGTAGVAPQARSGLEKPHLTIGLAVPTATYLPLYVAVDEGTFARQGLKVDLVEFRGGSELIKAIVSRSIDVGAVSLAEITSGIDAGQPLKAFYAGFNIPDFDWYGAASVKSLADAKGKKSASPNTVLRPISSLDMR